MNTTSPRSAARRLARLNSLPAAVAIVALLLGAGQRASAQINYWTGANSTDWNTVGNWNSASVPSGTGTDALFDSGWPNPGINISGLSPRVRALYFTGGNYSFSKSASETFRWQQIGQMGTGTISINPGTLSSDNQSLYFMGTGTGGITINGDLNTGTGTSFNKFTPAGLTLNGSLTFPASQTMRFRSGTTTFKGTMNALAGTLAIGERAAFNFGPVTITRLSDVSQPSFVLDDTGTATANRLGGSRGVQILTEGSFQYTGNATSASTETTTGNLNLQALAGGSIGYLKVASGSGQKAWLTFGALQNNGSTWGTDVNDNPVALNFLVNASDTLGAAGTTGGRVIFTTAPVLNNNILRYAIVKDSSDVNLATYDTTADNGGALGVKAYITYDVTTIGTDNTKNVNLSGSQTIPAAGYAFNGLKITPTAASQSINGGSYGLSARNAGGVLFKGGYDYSITGSGNFNLGSASGGYFYINANTLTVSCPFQQAGVFAKSGDGMLVFSGNYVNNSSRSICLGRGSLAQDDMQISGAISGSTSLRKGGQGILALTGSGDNSTWSAGVTLNAGTLVLAKNSSTLNNGALGSGTFAFNGGILMARGQPATLANAVTLGSIGGSTLGMWIQGDQSITWNGAVSMQSGQDSYLQNDSTATFTIGGGITTIGDKTLILGGSGTTLITGNLSATTCKLIKAGTGLVTLQGTAGYTGTTTIEGGTLRIDSANSMPAGLILLQEAGYNRTQGAILELGTSQSSFTRALGMGSGQVQFGSSGNNGAGGFSTSLASGATVNLGGAGATLTWVTTPQFVGDKQELQFGSSTAAGTLDFQNPIALGSAVRTIRVFDGPATIEAKLFGGIASGTAGLTKEGRGALELTTANTYSGVTKINGGTLLADNASGSATGTSTVTVNSGGKLGGSGTVSGAVTVNSGGTLLPGSTVGTLNLGGGLTLNSSALWTNDLSSTYNGSNDKVVVTGNLTANGNTVTINSAGTLDTSGNDYVLMTWTGTFSGTAFNSTPAWSGTTPANSANYSIVTDTVNKKVLLRYTSSGPDATQSTLMPTSASITANGSATQVLTVQAKDSGGNNLTSGGATVTITKQSGTGTIGSVTDNGNGTYTATVTAPTATGSGVFVATLGGNPVMSGGASQTQATITYVPGAADHLTITSSAADLNSGSTRSITAEVRDAYENKLTSDNSTSVTFTQTAGSGSVTGTGVATVSSGTASKTVTGAKIGSVTIQAQASGLTSGSTTFNIIGFYAPNVTYTNAPGIDRRITLADLQAAGLASSESSPSYAITGVSTPSAQGGTVAYDASNILYSYPTSGSPTTDSFTYTATDGVNSGTGTVSLTFEKQSGQVGTITVSGGVATLTLYGIPGVQYDAQRSTDLVTWTTLGVPPLSNAPPFTAASDGKVSFTDTNAPAGQAYYRTLQH